MAYMVLTCCTGPGTKWPPTPISDHVRKLCCEINGKRARSPDSLYQQRGESALISPGRSCTGPGTKWPLTPIADHVRHRLCQRWGRTEERSAQYEATLEKQMPATRANLVRGMKRPSQEFPERALGVREVASIAPRNQIQENTHSCTRNAVSCVCFRSVDAVLQLPSLEPKSTQRLRLHVRLTSVGLCVT
eukprot:3888322-Rhodomonas_salina.2